MGYEAATLKLIFIGRYWSPKDGGKDQSGGRCATKDEKRKRHTIPAFWQPTLVNKAFRGEKI